MWDDLLRPSRAAEMRDGYDIAGCSVRLDELVSIEQRVTGRKFAVKRLGRGDIEEELKCLG